MTKMSLRPLFLILLFFNLSKRISSDCPKGCKNCNYQSLTCDGKSSKITRLPPSDTIPKDISRLIILHQKPEFEDVEINSNMFQTYTDQYKLKIAEIAIRFSGIKRIMSNAFRDMSHLKRIILSNNELGVIEDDAFKGLDLTMLVLQDNPSLKLNRYSLRGLTTVTLNLRKCGLESISYDIFNELGGNLQNLILEENKLHTIDKSFGRTFQSVRLLQLGNNPFNCNCELEWLANVLVILNQKDLNKNNVKPKCLTPASLHNRELEKIPATHFKCHPPYISEVNLDLVSSTEAILKCIPKSSGVVRILYSRLTPSGERTRNEIYGNAREASQISSFNITRIADDERFRCLFEGIKENSSANVRIRWPRKVQSNNVKVPLKENDGTDQPKVVPNSKSKSETELPHEPPAEKNFLFQKKYTLLEMIGAVIGTFTVTLALFLFIYRCFVCKRKKERKKSPYSNYNYEHNVMMFTPETQTYDIPHHPNYPPPPPPPPPRDHYLDYKNQRTLPYNRV